MRYHGSRHRPVPLARHGAPVPRGAADGPGQGQGQRQRTLRLPPRRRRRRVLRDGRPDRSRRPLGGARVLARSGRHPLPDRAGRPLLSPDPEEDGDRERPSLLLGHLGDGKEVDRSQERLQGDRAGGEGDGNGWVGDGAPGSGGGRSGPPPHGVRGDGTVPGLGPRGRDGPAVRGDAGQVRRPRRRRRRTVPPPILSRPPLRSRTADRGPDGAARLGPGGGRGVAPGEGGDGGGRRA